jgi:hypothetical protein
MMHLLVLSNVDLPDASMTRMFVASTTQDDVLYAAAIVLDAS